MLGQKGFLVNGIVENIQESNLDSAMNKIGVKSIWEEYKQEIKGNEYIIVGMYSKTLSIDKSAQFRNMIYRLRDEGRINPLSIKGNKRANLMGIINPDYSNVGYPLTLLNKKDFLCVMCMLDVEKVGKIMSNNLMGNRKPSNKFESLVLK